MRIEERINKEHFMSTPKSHLEKLTTKQIEKITAKAERKRNVPRVISQQVNMRLDGKTLQRAKELAQAQGIAYTTFLTRLLREDIDRLWDVFRKVG